MIIWLFFNFGDQGFPNVNLRNLCLMPECIIYYYLILISHLPSLSLSVPYLQITLATSQAWCEV